MTGEDALALLQGRLMEAQAQAESAKRVEAAFKLEVVKAQRAYIQAKRIDPHTAATLALDKRHRAAVRQWAQAQADAGRAYRSLVALNAKLPRSGAGGAGTRWEARNGFRVHPGPARPLEGQHGLPA